MKTLDQTVQATSGSAAAVDQVDAVGHRHHLPGRHGHPLGVPAAGQQRAHLVADRPARRRPRRARRSAAALQAEDVRGARRRRVEALPLQEVGAVDGRGATSTTTSPGPGSGSGRSPTDRTSGPPDRRR